MPMTATMMMMMMMMMMILTYAACETSSLFQEQNRETASKLGRATLAMFTLPLLVFYVCSNFVFSEKEDPMMWGGFTAVLMVNVVIAGYVYSAFNEEDDAEVSDNDESGPRTGAFKRRTD